MIMKFIAKFITNERVLELINSNRFRGGVIVFVTWLVNAIFPGLFSEDILGGFANEIILFLGGITYLVGKNEAENRKYSTKEKRWKEEA